MRSFLSFLCFLSLTLVTNIVPKQVSAQCGTLAASVTANESRCAATGSISINASGGVAPATYQYRISSGPVTTAFTSVNTISALPPGNYTVIVRDVTANCSITIPNIRVNGNYVAPGVFFSSTAITCMNGSNGTIFVTSQTGGRAPFSYQIIAPSPAEVGTVSSTGTFTGLIPGLYTIRLTDSCGGIQTRNQRVNNYTWSILSSSTVIKSSCQNIDVNVYLTNSNNVNSPSAVYSGFSYGVSRFPGDTTWFTTPAFNFNIGTYRSVSIVVKDECGLVIRSFSWSDTSPSISSPVATSNFDCSTFSATVNGQTNMNAAFTQYCLYDQSNTTLISPCQSSNVFNNVPYGTYTIRIVESCYDTTIERTVSALAVEPAAGVVIVNNRTCANFSVTVNGLTNLTNPVYKLYNAANDTQIGADQTSAVFTLVPYGSYCIRIVNDPACFDTTIVRCFSEVQPLPSVDALVTTSDQSCATFTATVSGQTNVENPVYRLFNSANDTQIGADQTSPVFTNVPYGSYCIRVVNDPACLDTTIVRCFTEASPVPSLASTFADSDKGCATFTATVIVTSQQNTYNLVYQLFNGANDTQVGADQASPVFTNVPYGSYCIRIKNDATCYDTSFVNCFTVEKPLPSLSAAIDVSDKACATFTATATITSQQNTYNLVYQLFNSANDTQVGADQASPVFTNVPYGSYCIRIKNDATCYDTSFVNCFTVEKPLPSLSAAIDVSDKACATFTATATITSQQNIYNPVYQLFNGANDTQVGSDQSGPVFTNVPYGTYCIRIKNDAACYDTSFVNCFTAEKPVPSMSTSVVISDKVCATFTATATISSQQNINNPVYQLFNSANDTQIGADQTSEIFTLVPYGSYCIRIKNDAACYDTTFVNCFTADKLAPSVDAAIALTDQTCSSFTATVTGQVNISNPIYQLYNSANDTQIGTNQASPVFTAIPYGDYCIRIVNDAACNDTTIVRCFISGRPLPVVDPVAEITDKTCATFTATITGQTNVENPVYQLFNGSNDTQVGTDQTSPVFTALPYGSYCIRVKNDASCYDTTFVNCFTENKLVPSVDPLITISDKACSTFTATVTGQVNINNPVYRLYNSANDTQIGADQGSPVFTNVPYGSYCIRVVNDAACYDTTIVNCFAESALVPALTASVDISDKLCASFTATASIISQQNISNPVYRLFDAANTTQIGADQTSPVFTAIPYGSYNIRVVNDAACYDTAFVFPFTADKLVPAVDPVIAISDKTCGTFTATVTGQVNINNPIYQIYNGANDTQVGSDQTSPVFTNVPYGSYCIRVVNDATCYDTTIVNCFTENALLPTLTSSVDITDKVCATFTATVTITSQSNVFNPVYQLFDAANATQIGANQNSPVFTAIPYGSYTIRIANDAACYDTAFVNAFSADKLIPSVDNVVISDKTCGNFTATVTGQLNINNPVYQLYNAANDTQIGADQTSPVFTAVPYGSYCIRIKNDAACYDTTMVSCFTEDAAVPTLVSTIDISDKACATFTATVTIISQSNVFNPVYRLFDETNTNQIGTDQTSPVFTGVPYGKYNIRIVNDLACFDITFVKTFTVDKLVPSVAAAITITDKTCTGFTATVTGQVNLFNPVYRLFNSANDTQIGADQTNPEFSGVPYGSYCIRIVNDAACYDSTIVRCFTTSPASSGPSISTTSATGTCSLLGGSDVVVSVLNSAEVYIYKIYSPAGVLLGSISTTSTTHTFTDMPEIPVGTQYQVTVEDGCGIKDSAFVTPVAYYIDRSLTKTVRCPSGTNPFGTGDITLTLTQNIGSYAAFNINIIKKDGAVFFQTPDTRSTDGEVAEFYNLEPASYIVETYSNVCNKYLYDTVEISNYAYPNLSNSKGYFCDNGLQSISSSTIGGVPPLQYQIFESLPVSPSINTAYQADPVFNINTGTLYELVRLRVLDACGNASINDVGFVPVANNIISTSNDCFNGETILSVDTVANAVYTWYKRTYNPTDSVLLGSGPAYTIPFLTIADTGLYICNANLNNGCIINNSYRNVNGNCKASIGNWVWLENSTGPDANNGLQDPGENGMPGVTVNLLNSVGSVINTTTTDSSGFYLFTDIVPGNYSIQVVLPTGFAFTTQTNLSDNESAIAQDGSDVDVNSGISYLVNLVAGESETDIDAGLIDGNLVPVTFESFTATPENSTVRLRWAVSQEINVADYTIEHGTTPNALTNKIGKVPAHNNRNYSLVHPNPVYGINYYRLKITDKDGKLGYSEIKKVNFGKTGQVSVYPNPVRDMVNVTFGSSMVNKPSTITLISGIGQTVFVKQILFTNQTETINLPSIPNGNYILQVTTATETVNTSIQVLK